ncbi:MAG: hypothetical protein POELPBGB_02380 [Bacteroidia bacterium]|nr:hypothetical protein [Bacteroidia bacterium]
MFFYLSKIFAFLVSPFSWIVFFLLLGIFAKDARRKKRSLITSVVLLLFFSNSFILDEFTHAWEIEVVKYGKEKPHDIGIVLGGGVTYDAISKRVKYGYNMQRYTDAIDLYKRGIIKKILVSSGSGSMVYDWKEADWIQKMYVQFGVAQEDIWVENRSRNTAENAHFSKQMLDSLNFQGTAYLITSATHMRRSIACFSKAGIKADPYSVNKMTGKRLFYPDHLFLPNPYVLAKWDNLIHEWIGCIAYKLTGKM